MGLKAIRTIISEMVKIYGGDIIQKNYDVIKKININLEKKYKLITLLSFLRI